MDAQERDFEAVGSLGPFCDAGFDLELVQSVGLYWRCVRRSDAGRRLGLDLRGHYYLLRYRRPQVRCLLLGAD